MRKFLIAFIIILAEAVLIYAQNATPVKVGSEFQLNTYTTDNQDYTDIAIHSDGSFIVVWSSNGQDGSLKGVYGQWFDSAGNKAGNEFRVNTYIVLDQLNGTK